jgi:predicted DNA-binding transcriptional regulator YafY
VHALLDDGSSLTYEELAARLELSERTIRRAITELRSAGVDVGASGRPRQFALAPSARRSSTSLVSLTRDEILALELAAHISSAVLSATPLGDSLRSAVERVLTDDAIVSIAADRSSLERQWYFAEAPSAPIDAGVFESLRDAVDDQRSVLIDYYTAHSNQRSSARKVDPYCIAVRSGSWILVAHCHQRSSIREFNLTDITNVLPCDPAHDTRAFFGRPESFDPEVYFRDRFRMIGGGEVFEVRMVVEAGHVAYFRRKVYHPTQQISPLDDGRALVSFEVEGLDEIRSFAQSWGPAVTVVAPRELVERMKDDASTVHSRYFPSKPATTDSKATRHGGAS